MKGSAVPARDVTKGKVAVELRRTQARKLSTAFLEQFSLDLSIGILRYSIKSVRKIVSRLFRSCFDAVFAGSRFSTQGGEHNVAFH